MRPSARLLASFAAGALVAVPGLAVAQGGLPTETPPLETPPVETPTPDDDVPPVELPTAADSRTTPDDVEEVEELEAEEVEVEEVEDEDAAGHGAWISALAECLPSGADLHGTGFTKGHVISQAATTGEVVLGEGDEALPVTSVEEAEALCQIVQDLADQADAPERAQGRPDWAGPEGDDGPGEAASGSRPGPPAHANAGGKGR